MYEPIRGGTRGGQAEFKWSDVSADKDREHYLGHSINAPTGRWQKNKDVHWYNRDIEQGEEEKRAEIRRVKEAEEEAMAQALGFAPTKKSIDASKPNTHGHSEGPSGSNAIPINAAKEDEKKEKRLRKLEKRAKKAEKKALKELRRTKEPRDRSVSEDEDRHHYSSRRSRSPSRDRSRERLRRSHSPAQSRMRRSVSPPRRRYNDEDRRRRDYDWDRQRRRDDDLDTHRERRR